MDKLKAKREERAELENKLDALVEIAESKELTEDQKKEFKELEAKIKAVDEEIALLEKIEDRKKQKARAAIDDGRGAVGAPQDDEAEFKEKTKLAKRYMFSKAFKAIHSKKPVDGVEAEIFQEASNEAKDSGETLQGNIAIPSWMIKVGKDRKTKLLDVATESADLVYTEYGGLIPILNPNPVSAQLGITVLQGLRGNVQWTRETADPAFAWETESSDVNETTPTFDNISVSPKRVGGYVDITQQLLKQSPFMLEPWLRNKLNLRYELTVDDAVIDGAGASNEPAGIFNYSGTNVLSLGSAGGDMTYAALLSMIRDTKVAKSRNGSSGWLTNAYGEYALSITPRQTSGVEGNFILNPDDQMLVRRRFLTSETVRSDYSEGGQSDLIGMIYSSYWQGCILATWGGLDILFDPYTQALGAKVRFVCNAFMDIEIEHAAEFSICKDWDATDLPALT